MSQKLLHANVFGEGKPLFILHGFLGMGDNWKTLGKQFAKDGYQVHLIDQRNHGRSFHDDVFNYEALSEDLKRFLRLEILCICLDYFFATSNRYL